MKKEIALPAATYLAAVVFMFACSESTVPGVDTTGELDTEARITSALAQMDAGASAASSAASSGGTAGTAPAPQGGQKADPCVYDATTKRRTCPQTTAPNGMKQDLYFQLLDAAGNAQAAFDTATTVGIRRVTTRAGTLNQQITKQDGTKVDASMAITEQQDMVLSGLKTKTPEQNGTGTMKNIITRVDLPNADTVEVAQTFAKIFIDPAPTAPKYPKGGSITSEFTNKLGNGTTNKTKQVTTYDGTTVAKTVITLQNGSTKTCTYDMTKTQQAPSCTTP